jgi:pimeloyl-ACP methyl ester carboxylesterase
MHIDSLEDVRLGDTTQWIRIRGTDASNPVLLLIQQGPGLPMINEVARFERTLGLEEAFTVVYWDQRGCGRSLRSHTAADEITVDQMVDDTVALLELLHDRFGGSTFVVGFSLGATIGAAVAAWRPDLVAALVAVGMDVDGARAERAAYDYAVGTARIRGERHASRQLEAIGRPPHRTVQQFGVRVRWATNFGGVSRDETYGSLARGLVASLLRSPDYSPADVVRTLRGIRAARAALLRELASLDLVESVPAIAVPVTLVQGRQDRVSPGEGAQRYLDRLEAPRKQLVWFEFSAHTPHLDEPDEFRDLLLEVRGGRPAGTFVESSRALERSRPTSPDTPSRRICVRVSPISHRSIT